MLCSEFNSRMHRLLDERTSPELDSALLRHSHGCASCQAQLVTLSRLLDTLEFVEVPDLPTNFAQRVVASLDEPRPATIPTGLTSTWVRVAAAIAATLLLAAFPATWYLMSHSRAVAQPKPVGGSFDQSPPPASSEHAPTSPDIVGESWMVSGASILELYPEETRRRHRQQVTQIADDLLPIATPFNATMTAIRRSIPVGKSGARGEPRASVGRPVQTRDLS